MSDESGAGRAGTAPTSSAAIVIRFPDGGTGADVQIDPATTPGHVYLAAMLLDMIAREVRTSTLMRSAAMVPGAAPAAGEDELTRIANAIMRGRPT